LLRGFELTSQEFDLLIGIVEKTVLCVVGQLDTLGTVFLRSGGSCTAFEGTLVLLVLFFEFGETFTVKCEGALRRFFEWVLVNNVGIQLTENNGLDACVRSLALCPC
jgi:hypothetical protein